MADEESNWILGVEHGITLAANAEAELIADDPEYDFVEIDFLPPQGSPSASEDDSSAMMFVCNCSSVERVAYISVTPAPPSGGGAEVPAPLAFFDRDNSPLQVGRTTRLPHPGGNVGDTRNEEGSEDDMIDCITFVLILPPNTGLYTARVASAVGLEIHKLAFERKRHPDPEGTRQHCVPRFTHFPLGKLAAPVCPKASTDQSLLRGLPSSFLCTQGCGGALTHFFPESFHAVDFRCAEGTEVRAVAPGIVTEVEQHNSVTGVHCNNLCSWNSVQLEAWFGTDGRPRAGGAPATDAEAAAARAAGYVPVQIDYVHVAPGSARVSVGDRVEGGAVLCLSGKVGFSPEPHVHIEVHRSADPTGPSLLVSFDPDGEAFPRAGDLCRPRPDSEAGLGCVAIRAPGRSAGDPLPEGPGGTVEGLRLADESGSSA
jgi:murein DD-endopeptidase MepM/ murein hydrolase activator NlpD